MKIDDNIKICEALGLDANKVKMLEIRIYPKGAFVEATMSIEPGLDAAETIESVLKKYTLVETPGDEEETPETTAQEP